MIHFLTATVLLARIFRGFCAPTIYDVVKHPEAMLDSGKIKKEDLGMNIFGTKPGHILRISALHPLGAADIPIEYLNPEHSILVFSHGWDPAWTGSHNLTDAWDGSACAKGANPAGPGGKPETCPVNDHNAMLWKNENWDVIFLDWKWYANKPFSVLKAQDELYKKGANVEFTLFDDGYTLELDLNVPTDSVFILLTMLCRTYTNVHTVQHVIVLLANRSLCVSLNCCCLYWITSGGGERN